MIVFSLPIYFIVFRESLEAAIIVSVLLSLVEQLTHDDGQKHESQTQDSREKSSADTTVNVVADDETKRRLARKLRMQILLGAGFGFLLAFILGAAFIAVWFTQASDLYKKSEELWEGVFQLIAAIMLFAMGITMLRLSVAKAKWRVKLQRAIEGNEENRTARSGKWGLFLLPFVTVVREGLEAVIFVGGVALGQPARSIPLAAIMGIISGLTVGFILYRFASRTTFTIFLICVTNLLLLMGAGLFKRCVAAFENYRFGRLLGTDVDDAQSAGNGPGSYDVRGNVWHLNCCNPQNKLATDGWIIFGGLFGWSNNASIGTVLAYVMYWLAVIVTLIWIKFKEGRTKLFGFESAAAVRRREAREAKPKTESAIV